MIRTLNRMSAVLLTGPPLLMAGAMAALYFLNNPTSHESSALLLVLNVLFTTVVSAFIALLAARSFLHTGRPTLLAICVGMTVWGGTALVAVVGQHIGNYNITIHNLGIAVSGLCHLAGAIAVYRHGEQQERGLGGRLAFGVASALCAVGAIWMATQEAWLPMFFVEGAGATQARTFVLLASIAIFGLAALLIAVASRRSGSLFLLWYAGGLVLIAIGAAGLILQPTHGSWLGWVARSTQYLAGVYMLAGTLLTVRESGDWKISLEERLLLSERLQREQADLIRLVNDNTSDLIFMKDRTGHLTYANAATLRLIGRARLDDRPPDTELFFVADERAETLQNDRHVMQTGEVLEVEETYIGADGVTRTFLCTKSPLQDEHGEIIGVIGVGRDITERIAAEAALRNALAAAEMASAALKEADVRKDEFLAILGHELRNPLAPLRNSVEILKLTRAEDEEMQRAVGMMDRQLHHLARLVDDLIDASRITRDKLELRKLPLDLVAILQQTIESCQPLIRQAGHALHVSLPREHLYVMGDAVRLAQMFSNILNNACKFTDDGGQLTLSLEQRSDDALITIADSGLGIPREKLGKIFEIFSQVNSTRERSQSGLGIGLTLAKRLAEMHGGEITAHSEGLGTGSTFVVRLPLASAVADADAGARPAAPTVTPEPAQRCLVVDDNRDAANSLDMLLQLSGYSTALAYDGLDAVEIAERFKPDVILLDIGLPGMSGYEVCGRIRRQPGGGEIFIVAVTGWGQHEDRAKSREAGFDHHMVKPIDYALLQTRLKLRLTGA